MSYRIGEILENLLNSVSLCLYGQLQPVGMKIAASQTKQAKYYNRTVKLLEKPQSGQLVRVKLLNEDKWYSGTCKQEVGSYLEECEETVYLQNRQHLRTTPEKTFTNTHREPDT